MADMNPYAPTAESATEPTLSQGSGRREFLRNLARAQRMVNLAALAYLCLFGISLAIIRFFDNFVGEVTLVVLGLGVVAFGGLAVFRLASLLRGKIVAAIYVVGMIIPYLGLLLLMLLSSQASSKLKRHGVRVGLLGADPDQI